MDRRLKANMGVDGTLQMTLTISANWTDMVT